MLYTTIWQLTVSRAHVYNDYMYTSIYKYFHSILTYTEDNLLTPMTETSSDETIISKGRELSSTGMRIAIISLLVSITTVTSRYEVRWVAVYVA